MFLTFSVLQTFLADWILSITGAFTAGVGLAGSLSSSGSLPAIFFSYSTEPSSTFLSLSAAGPRGFLNKSNLSPLSAEVNCSCNGLNSSPTSAFNNALKNSFSCSLSIKASSLPAVSPVTLVFKIAFALSTSKVLSAFSASSLSFVKTFVWSAVNGFFIIAGLVNELPGATGSAMLFIWISYIQIPLFLGL